MKQSLRFVLDDERLHPAFHQTMQSLAEAGRTGVELEVANALWGQQGYAFLQPFLDTNATFYAAGLQTVDFRTKTEAARIAINKWVEDLTLS